MVPIPMSPSVMKTPMIRKQKFVIKSFLRCRVTLAKTSLRYQNCESFPGSLVRMCIIFKRIWKFVNNP